MAEPFRRTRRAALRLNLSYPLGLHLGRAGVLFVAAEQACEVEDEVVDGALAAFGADEAQGALHVFRQVFQAVGPGFLRTAGGLAIADFQGVAMFFRDLIEQVSAKEEALLRRGESCEEFLEGEPTHGGATVIILVQLGGIHVQACGERDLLFTGVTDRSLEGI